MGDRLFSNNSDCEKYLNYLNMEHEFGFGPELRNKNFDMQMQLKAEGFYDDSLILNENYCPSNRNLNSGSSKNKYYIENQKETVRIGNSTPLRSINLNYNSLRNGTNNMTPVSSKKIFNGEENSSKIQMSQTRSRINKAFEFLRTPSIDTSRMNMILGDVSRNDSNFGLSASAIRRKNKIFDEAPKSPAYKEKILMDKNEFIYKNVCTPRGVSSHGRFDSKASIMNSLSATKRSSALDYRSNRSSIDQSAYNSMRPKATDSATRGIKKYLRPGEGTSYYQKGAEKQNKENDKDISLSEIDNIKMTIKKSLDQQKRTHISVDLLNIQTEKKKIFVKLDKKVLVGFDQIKNTRAFKIDTKNVKSSFQSLNSPALAKSECMRPEAPEGVKRINPHSLKFNVGETSDPQGHQSSPNTPRIPDDEADNEKFYDMNSDDRIDEVFKKWRKEEEKSFSETTSEVLNNKGGDSAKLGGLESSTKILFICIFLATIYIIFNAGLEYSMKKFKI